jgi:hypothetical protein
MPDTKGDALGEISVRAGEQVVRVAKKDGISGQANTVSNLAERAMSGLRAPLHAHHQQRAMKEKGSHEQ